MSAELIRSYYEAFNGKDVAGMIALLADEVVHDVNQGGRELGRAAFRAFLERMNRHYDEQIVGLVVMGNEAGARFAAEFEVIGTYLATDEGLPEAHGQRYRLPAGAFFEVRGGRIQRVTMYYNLAQWKAQVADGAATP